MKLNLGCGKKLKPREEGWVNIDKFKMPGVDRVVNLFTYPWPFEDSSVDEFYSSHLIEHIPHEAKPICYEYIDPRKDPEAYERQGRMEARWRELKDLDGFFAFFAEIWRIGKPDAKVELVAPFGYTHGALQDPTHTRYIMGQTFSYLTNETNDNFDYHLPFTFKIDSADLSIDNGFAHERPEEVGFALAHYWDVAVDMVVKLRVVK